MTKPMFYDFSFALKLENKLNHLTFFPLPTTNDYQKIENLKINAKIIKESKFGNSLAVSQSSQILSFQANLYEKKSLARETKVSVQDIKTDEFINGEDPKIKKIANSIKGNSASEILQNSYSWTLDYLTYGNPYKGLYSYNQAMQEKITDCGGFSTLLASILNAKGIKTRLVLGFLVSKNLKTKLISKIKSLGFENLLMHAWLEAEVSKNDWFVMDPSIEWRRNKGLTKRQGGFGFVPNDRLVVSFGEDFDIRFEGKNYNLDILQNPVSFKI